MHPSANSILPLAGFLLLIAILFIGLNLNPNQIPSPLIGQPSPKFSLSQLINPDAIVSHNDFVGKVVLFNVWATWCVSCRHEHPVLMQLAQNGIPIYGLNYKDERPAAIELLKDYGNPYVVSAFDADGRVGIDWGVYGTPETFIIDRQGVIRYKHTGPISPNDAANIINPWVQKLRTEPTSRDN
ncbi:thiol:disulfide interchange protein [Achromatium sp. WMS1]|nr:thiol:disulfide interchange protein [Achromatium sp. WMS1]